MSISSIKTHLSTLVDKWQPVTTVLDALQSPAALLARIYVGKAFFDSGLTKLNDWGTTLLLFKEEYKVPFLPYEIAAYLGTAGELVLPVMLVLGIGTRFAALGLSVVNVVAVVSLAEIAPAAYQQHLLWGALLAMVAVYGAGKWTVESKLSL